MNRRFRITIEVEVIDAARLATAVEAIAVPANFETIEEWRDYRSAPGDQPVMADLKEWIPSPPDSVNQNLITCVEIDHNGMEI